MDSADVILPVDEGLRKVALSHCRVRTKISTSGKVSFRQLRILTHLPVGEQING